MKFITLRKCLQVALILAIPSLMWGCGHGGVTSPNEVVGKVASVSVIPSGNGVYVIQGDNMGGVAGMELTISYDSPTLSSPTVTQGEFIAGALMVANTTAPGTIKIAIITAWPKAFTGSGPIATVSFAAVTGKGSVSIASVKMVDAKGAPVP